MDEEKKPETKSSFWSKNPKRKYLGLWYVIDDYDSAKVAANETMNIPAYPLELFQRVITVSLETMKIVKSLPKLDIE